jgi:hypothetical protein
MTGGMKYGDVALGVEAAFPAFRPERHPGRVRRFLAWLIEALGHRA